MTVKVIRHCLLIFLLTLAFPLWAGVYDDILIAANNDQTDTVMDLIRRGMDPNTVDARGNSLLMIAARNGNLQLLESLLKIHANYLKNNNFNEDALMLAAYHGHLACVQKLLSFGATAERDNGSWSPLLYAAYAGWTNVAALLLDNKSSVNQVGPNGETALMLAARNGHKEAVQMLLARGADPDLRNPSDLTASDLATKAGNQIIADLIKSSRKSR
ncbi:MAG: ankyrin repeat domain-containing protein [Proteobacteria bacterium]|nr:ankyrin repeat domain-containing protein [Pseudomonadota bacterium]HQR02509.1 ankyrin repeat domain-containing protein [Rhodocyclaceae bacterium]